MSITVQDASVLLDYAEETLPMHEPGRLNPSFPISQAIALMRGAVSDLSNPNRPLHGYMIEENIFRVVANKKDMLSDDEKRWLLSEAWAAHNERGGRP